MAAYKKEYPIINQQAPIAGMLDTIGPEVFPMPRYWFISEDEVNLIQVQKNAFIFNWRRRNGDYPHFFENLKPAFDKNFSVFEEFLRAETETTNLPIDLCELTYVNVIERCEYWSGPADTPNVIPSFCVPDIGVEAGIKLARQMLPTMYFDEDKTMQLVHCLKRYRRTINQNTNEPGAPLHDEFSHGADAIRYLAVIADKLTNDIEPIPMPRIRTEWGF